MRLAFMSSVCPKMSLPELLQAAQGHGYAGLEIRPEWKQAHGIELETGASARSEARKIIRDSGIEPCALSPGNRYAGVARAEYEEHLEALKSWAQLAADTGIPLIRVFGDPMPTVGPDRQTAYALAGEFLAQAATIASRSGITLCLETHGNLRGADAGEMLARAGYPPALMINWHLSHCLRHGETVDEAYRHVKGRVRHVHFSVEEKEIPHLLRQMELLEGEGYGGFYSVEVINPEKPEDVLRKHADWWRARREE